MSKLSHFALFFSLLFLIHNVAASTNYLLALDKSLLYFEAQRSGKLPPNQRVQWRANSAPSDGKDAGIDLTGGYYDAGDNVKFGLPLAFTITMLSWSVAEYRAQLQARNELSNAMDAVTWGTDYLMKANAQPNVLYGQVGDGASDHACWQRPEDMTTPRTAYKIDAQHPGSDLAGETAAAFAAAAVANQASNPQYASRLLNQAKQLFVFAKTHTGLYHDSIPSAAQFYKSSGYQDELLWAAAWLYRATNDNTYFNFIAQSTNSGGTRTTFSWDDKYIGLQVLIAKGILEGKLPGNGTFGQYKFNAEQYICNCLQKGSNNIKRTRAGLLWFDDFNNLQYVTSASFVITVYADVLASTKNTLRCTGGVVGSQDLINFVRSLVDYILGSNPKQLSYMIGFGTNYPKHVHHRGASIVSIKKDPTFVSCSAGYAQWFNKNADNPNVINGAIVGGPNQNDEYTDLRSNFMQAEPATANVAPIVGVLARLA